MAGILTSVVRDSPFLSEVIFTCKPENDYNQKCRACRNLTEPFEVHEFVRLKDASEGIYRFISFRNVDGMAFNPLAKGIDLSGYGNALIFRHTFLNRVFPLDEDLRNEKPKEQK